MAKMKMLTKEEIVDTKDISIEIVEVSEWGGSVGIKRMSGAERDEYDQALYNRSDDKGKITNVKGVKVLLLSRTICDTKGNLLFPENADREILRQKSASAIERLFEKAGALNGIGPEEVKELGKKL